jgi:hypothetical protein
MWSGEERRSRCLHAAIGVLDPKSDPRWPGVPAPITAIGRHSPRRREIGHYACVGDNLDPTIGAGSEDVDKWERYASGEPFPVDPDDGGLELRRRDPLAELWSVIALGLASAAALFLLAAVLESFQWSGVSLRDRLFLVATQGGSWPSALLVLAAASALLAGRGSNRPELGRWAVRCCAAVSLVILVSTGYAIAYLALAHPSGSSTDFGAVLVQSQISEWSERVGGMLEMGASGLLAGLALFVLRRTTQATDETR